MSVTVVTLVLVLAIWMLICAWCGFRKRFVAFAGALIAGLALNMVWMVFGLQAKPFGANALMAEMSALMYGVAAFGIGWLAGRLVRQWRASRVE